LDNLRFSMAIENLGTYKNKINIKKILLKSFVFKIKYVIFLIYMSKILLSFYVMMLRSSSLLLSQEKPKVSKTTNVYSWKNVKTLKEEMTANGFQCCNIKEVEDLCKIYKELEIYIETAKEEAKQLTIIDFDATIPQQLFSFNFTKSPAVFKIKDESNKFMIAFPDLKKVIVATIFFKDNPNRNENEKFLSFCVNTTGKFTDKLQAYQKKIGLIFLFTIGFIGYICHKYKKKKKSQTPLVLLK